MGQKILNRSKQPLIIPINYSDLNIGCAANLLQELPAMSTRVSGDDDVGERGKGWVNRDVGDEELLGVDGVVEGQSWEFEIDSDEDAAVCGQAGGGDGETGDRGAGEGEGGGGEGGEELRERDGVGGGEGGGVGGGESEGGGGVVHRDGGRRGG